MQFNQGSSARVYMRFKEQTATSWNTVPHRTATRDNPKIWIPIARQNLTPKTWYDLQVSLKQNFSTGVVKKTFKTGAPVVSIYQ